MPDLWGAGEEGLLAAGCPVQGHGLGQEGAPFDVVCATQDEGAGQGLVERRWERRLDAVIDGIRFDLGRFDGLTSMPRVVSDWISLAEASSLLASSNVRFAPETIGRWARSGRLQSIKVGNRRFVRKAEVRGLLRPLRRVRVEELQPGLFEELPG